MTIKERAAAIAVAVSALVPGFGGYCWLQEHDARLRAEAQSGAQQRQIDNLKQQATGIQDALDAKLAGIARERQLPATARQLVSETTDLLPELPVPVRVQAAPKDAALPDGPSTQEVVIPEADFRAVRDAELDCKEDSTKLSACQDVQADLKQQLKLAESQRDEWKSAARGGSFWHRAVGAAKWFAIGAGAGAAGYAVAHHR